MDRGSGGLDARTRRIREALSRGAVASGTGGEAPSTDAAGEKALRKGLRRRLRDGRRDDEGLPHAIVFGGAAIVMVALVLRQPWVLWWMIFPAFGFGMAAASILTRLARRRREGAPRPGRLEVTLVRTAPAVAAAEEGADDPALAAIAAREARVGDVCDRLLRELKESPEVVRELIPKPEETVEALKAASAELARRERDLRRAVTPSGDGKLREEREALEARVAAEGDDVVRERLSAAAQAIDGQLAQRRELARAVARIEAEGTRILYSLENLRAQVLRVRAAGAAWPDPSAEGLRDGLAQLSREMDAVATALEEIHSASAQPMPPGDRTARAAQAARSVQAGRG